MRYAGTTGRGLSKRMAGPNDGKSRKTNNGTNDGVRLHFDFTLHTNGAAGLAIGVVRAGWLREVRAHGVCPITCAFEPPCDFISYHGMPVIGMGSGQRALFLTAGLGGLVDWTTSLCDRRRKAEP